MLMIRITYIVAIAAAILAGGWFLDTLVSEPGTLTLDYGGRIYAFSLFQAALIIAVGILAILLALVALRFVLAVLQFPLNFEIGAKSRERRGLDALSKGMIALAAGDGKTALKKAKIAEKNLRRPHLTRLLNAEASKLAGDGARALNYYKALAAEDVTAFVGTHGLIERAMLDENIDGALGLVDRALELNPKDGKTLELAYTLQSQKFDWSAARKTVQLQRKFGALPKPKADEREAALALAQSEDADRDGSEKQARALAVEAAKLDPGNVNAVSTAVRHLLKDDAKRAATKLVRDAWQVSPHPQLAAAYAAIEPDESPMERRRRFEELFAHNDDHEETQYLRAELALVAEDWRGARNAIEDLRETEPSARSCAIMAAIARGENEPEHIVRGWLARGLAAPRGESLTPEIINTAMLPLLVSPGSDETDAEVSSGQPEPAEETPQSAAPSEEPDGSSDPDEAAISEEEQARKPESVS